MANDGQAQSNRALDRRVFILALGRFLSMMGSGFTTFYGPVYFVNFMHVSATLVGLGLAANSLAGTGARIIGGCMSDSPRVGRRTTLVTSTAVLGVASALMGLVQDFAWFVAGITLLGFAAGLYWPASDAMIADVTTETNRRDAYAVSRFADYCGLGGGIVLAGLAIQFNPAYRIFFFAGSAAYFALSATALLAMAESKHSAPNVSLLKSWAEALRNPLLQLYVAANILMTAYVTQVTSTMPLYFSDRVRVAPGQPLTPAQLSALTALYVVVLAICQIPLTRVMNRFTSTRSLIISCVIWFGSFLLICVCGLTGSFQIGLAAAALILMSLATAAYAPPASALIVDLAPAESVAIYFSINSLCWAIGGMAGPPLVLAAMDHFPRHTPFIWLFIGASTLLPALVFQKLSRHTAKQAQGPRQD